MSQYYIINAARYPVAANAIVWVEWSRCYAIDYQSQATNGEDNIARMIQSFETARTLIVFMQLNVLPLEIVQAKLIEVYLKCICYYINN